MNAPRKQCPECSGPMRIDYSHIGRWICLACDHAHTELPEDESTWLERWRPEKAGAAA